MVECRGSSVNYGAVALRAYEIDFVAAGGVSVLRSEARAKMGAEAEAQRHSCLAAEAVSPGYLAGPHRVARRACHAVPPPAEAHGAPGDTQEDERHEGHPERYISNRGAGRKRCVTIRTSL